jgi:hypothetical protein
VDEDLVGLITDICLKKTPLRSSGISSGVGWYFVVGFSVQNIGPTFRCQVEDQTDLVVPKFLWPNTNVLLVTPQKSKAFNYAAADL